MISALQGKVIERAPPWLVVALTSGIAYELQVPLSTFSALAPEQVQINLYTHLNVREDALNLYGFLTLQERTLFRLLIKINGVGPKLALAILSSMDSDTFIHHIHADNSQALTRLPGVGKKTAERLLVEMRDKLKDWQPGATGAVSTQQQGCMPVQNEKQAAIEALQSLGYKQQEAARLIAGIDGEDKTVEEMIRLALQGVPA